MGEGEVKMLKPERFSYIDVPLQRQKKYIETVSLKLHKGTVSQKIRGVKSGINQLVFLSAFTRKNFTDFYSAAILFFT